MNTFPVDPVPTCSTAKSAQGMTLPEMIVALFVGSLVLLVTATVFMTSARSFAALGHYVNMDNNSRNALDQMTREIRQAGDLIEFSPTHLKFSTYKQTNSFLVYDWDANSRKLTSLKTGQATPKVLLSECDELAFNMTRGTFVPTTIVSQGKAIKVTWKCSRKILGQKMTTEDMEQALIIIRNKRT